MPARLDGRRGRNSLGMHMTRKSLTQQRDELKRKMEQLEKKQAKLEKEFSEFMRILLEEADGVQSGAAPTIPNQPKRGYCM
jgi:23S rRNA A2030 N6-methylase RlmJ